MVKSKVQGYDWKESREIFLLYLFIMGYKEKNGMPFQLATKLTGKDKSTLSRQLGDMKVRKLIIFTKQNGQYYLTANPGAFFESYELKKDFRGLCRLNIEELKIVIMGALNFVDADTVAVGILSARKQKMSETEITSFLKLYSMVGVFRNMSVLEWAKNGVEIQLEFGNFRVTSSPA